MSERKGKHRPRLPSRLVKQLWEWATQEMMYATNEKDSLNQEDMQMLVRGELAGFWDFVVKHVKSQSNAEVIRGNVSLHTTRGKGGPQTVGGRDGERMGLERERDQLEREVTSLRMAVQQMHRDNSQLRQNITQSDESVSGIRNEVSRLSCGSALMTAHSKACQERCRVLHEFACRMRARIEMFHRPVEKEASYFTTKHCVEDEERRGGTTTSGLESACTHEVRIICSQLEEALSGSYSDTQKIAEKKRARDHSWKQIENLLSHYSPGEILSSLAGLTQRTADRLHSHTLSIDLNRDARQLKYSYYDNTGMQDVSEQPQLLHTVEEHLMEAQLSHIRRSMESECAQKAARLAQSQAAELQSIACELLKECYSDQQDTDDVELAKLLYTRLELDYAGSLAALEKLSSLCSMLEQTRDQRKNSVDELQSKLKQIHEFAQVADSKQRQIQSLVAHNSSAKDRLQRQSTELQVYIQQNVLSHHEGLTNVTNTLRDSVAHEVQLFTQLSLDRLLKSPRIEVPTCDLSINRLIDHHSSGHPSCQELIKSLKISLNSAPEKMLTQLLNEQEKVESLEMSVTQANEILQQMRVIAINKDTIQAILKRCCDHDHELIERGVPALQECLSHASRGLADCERTEKTLEHWWIQPAQFLIPWVTQEEATSRQWVVQWRVLTAKFSELQQN